jgi:uncharacterized protein YbjT (DUF2867 family)
VCTGENALRASGVPYTIVRPGGLTNKPAGQHGLVAGKRTTSVKSLVAAFMFLLA